MSDSELVHATYKLARVLLAFVVCDVVLAIVTLLSKWYIRRENVALLTEQVSLLHETVGFNKEARETLQLVKGWAELARAARTEAERTAKASLETLAGSPTREELSQKLDSIPERTADVIDQRAKASSDSAVHLPKPPTPEWRP